MCADLCGREGVGVETPCRGGGRAPCPPPGRARPLLYLTLAGLGEAPRAGSWSHGAARRLRPRSRRPWARAAAGRGLRGLGCAGKGLRSGQSPVQAWQATPRLRALGETTASGGGCGMQALRPMEAREDGLVPWQQPMAVRGGARRPPPGMGLRDGSGTACAVGEAPPPRPRGQGPPCPPLHFAVKRLLEPPAAGSAEFALKHPALGVTSESCGAGWGVGSSHGRGRGSGLVGPLP